MNKHLKLASQILKLLNYIDAGDLQVNNSNLSSSPNSKKIRFRDSISKHIITNYSGLGTLLVATLIYKRSKTYVPVATGELKKSAKLIHLGGNKYRIMFDKPYALIQHECMDFAHNPPGRAKYLEDAAYDIYMYAQNNGTDIPFTFEIKPLDNGRIALDINDINIDKFLKNKELRDRLFNITLDDLED